MISLWIFESVQQFLGVHEELLLYHFNIKEHSASVLHLYSWKPWGWVDTKCRQLIQLGTLIHINASTSCEESKARMMHLPDYVHLWAGLDPLHTADNITVMICFNMDMGFNYSYKLCIAVPPHDNDSFSVSKLFVVVLVIKRVLLAVAQHRRLHLYHLRMFLHFLSECRCNLACW